MPDHSDASLYCDEDAGDWDADTCRLFSHTTSSSSPSLVVDSQPSDEFSNNLRRLIDTESDHMPLSDYVQRCHDRSVDITARQDSINWILKVHEYYNFRPVTAILSVNYLDRFLSTYNSPGDNGWRFQLLSVACLSLAAKMEELKVPPLLDLQVSDPKFVFEPKTVQRMELLVMETLKWRLCSVTPFDFVDHFISMLPSQSSSGFKLGSFNRIFSVSSDLILSTTRVIDFLGIPPSAIAAASVISAAGETVDLSASFYQRLNEDMVRSCHQLIEEYLIDTCPSSILKDRISLSAAPSSPVGVLDAAACGSCDTRGSSGHTEPPPSKRMRSSAPDVKQE